MSTNLLVAIKNIVEYKSRTANTAAVSSNRMNQQGEALEQFVKDAFCSCLGERSELDKELAHTKYLSYLGNQNNPPDFLIKGKLGDAVEVKKIAKLTASSSLALNSSHPKDKLYVIDPKISEDCKKADNGWDERDVLYVVGVVSAEKVQSLWFVYGDCYAAKKNTYERIATAIKSGIEGIPDIEFGETNELGRVNKVDPLGITYLRIRGMWGIDAPNKVFGRLALIDSSAFVLNALLLKSKYDALPQEDKEALTALTNDGLSVSDVKVKSPNNPAEMLDAKFLSFKQR